MKYNAGIKSMIDLRRRGEGVVKVIEHGRTRTEIQSTRAKAAAIAPAPAATARRRRCAAGRRTTPCSACTCRPTPARRGRVADAARRQREETYQFHRALITCEPAAARHGLERHGLAAFAGCDLCLLCLDHCCSHHVWDRRAEPRGSGAASSPMPLLCLSSVDGQPD